MESFNKNSDQAILGITWLNEMYSYLFEDEVGFNTVEETRIEREKVVKKIEASLLKPKIKKLYMNASYENPNDKYLLKVVEIARTLGRGDRAGAAKLRIELLDEFEDKDKKQRSTVQKLA